MIGLTAKQRGSRHATFYTSTMAARSRHGSAQSRRVATDDAWQMMYHDELPLVLYPEGTTRPVPPTYNPVDLVDADFPPSFVLVATKDQLIPVKHSYDFIDRLKARGVEHMVAEADMLHGCSENHPAEQKAEYDRWFEGAIRPGLDWVVERLRTSA